MTGPGFFDTNPTMLDYEEVSACVNMKRAQVKMVNAANPTPANQSASKVLNDLVLELKTSLEANEAPTPGM